MTGTPVTQGLQDLWAQFQFLSGKILECKSYVLFRNRYCIMGGFENRKKMGYQFEDDLLGRIKPYVYMVKKSECMDLPPKIFEKLLVSPTSEQKTAIKQLEDTYGAVSGDKVLTASMTLERLTRYQQIIGGTFPFDTEEGYDSIPIPGGNPKLEEIMDSIATLDEHAKVIIWARFRPEIRYIIEALTKVYGPSSMVEYHGGTSPAERERAERVFQAESSYRFFVSNQSTGGMGITLTKASYVYYYSNSFSYEDRIQSEDRVHRKGLVHSVTYIDVEMEQKYDKMILTAIYKKQDLAQMVDRELMKDCA
jgi:SNF2 family DNA or RNA helicase